ALSNMAPSWVAMDKRGRAITPIVTHQDRRSVDVARDLERRIGKARHLRLVGNRPIPGGISSTTWAWFNRDEPRLMRRRADLVGPNPGQLVNGSGSTDVLALCVDRPRPHEKLITRALGVGKLWLSVSTLAAGGSTLTWLHSRLFADLTDARFHALTRKLARRP